MTFPPYSFGRRESIPKRAWINAGVSWGLIAFYVLASARALVPGICATQAAMDVQCVVDTDVAVMTTPPRGCCTLPREEHTGGGTKRPVTPADSHCAFCNLLIAHTDPPLGFVLPPLPEATFSEQIPLLFQIAQEASAAAASNRAPPA